MRLQQIIANVIQEAISSEEKVVIIYGMYNYGKSTILKSLFDKYEYLPKIFQSGCNPAYRTAAVASLISNIQLINKTTGKKALLFLDEIDDAMSLNLIFQNVNMLERVYICTNSKIGLPFGEKLHYIDLNDRFSIANDYSFHMDISPGEFLSKNAGTEVVSIEKKKQSTHSLTIICCEDYQLITTLFFERDNLKE